MYNAKELAQMHHPHSDVKCQQEPREAMCRHRMKITRLWNIQDGDNVLELGCGHGEGSLALANAVGSQGHLTGIDNAPCK